MRLVSLVALRSKTYAVLLALLATTAWCQKVQVETDGSFDFTKHRTYMWRDHPLAHTDPAMQEAHVAADVVRSTVNSKLIRLGFHPVDANPDFFVTYFVTGQLEEELRATAAIGSTNWYDWDAPYYNGWVKYVVDQRLRGVLLLDFVEARSNHIAWRAYCIDTIKNMRTRDQKITRAIQKAFQKFPSTPAQR